MSHEEAQGLSAALKRLGEIVRDVAELAEDRHAFEFTGLVVGNELQRRRARQARGERLGFLESTEPLWIGRRRFGCVANGCTTKPVFRVMQ